MHFNHTGKFLHARSVGLLMDVSGQRFSLAIISLLLSNGKS